MFLRHLLALSLLLPASVAGQSKYTVTPRGVDLVELSSSSAIALNWTGGNTTRIQQADDAHTGQPRVLNSIAWRRNGTAATATAWTPTLDIYLGHTDINTFSTTFSNNYKTTPTLLFRGSQKLDWTSPSSLPVGLWSDATFSFTSPFLYNGTDALLWETQTTSTATTSSGYSLDWSATAPTTRSSLIPQVLGTGCTTGNGVMGLATSFTVDSTPNYTSKWDVTATASNAPVSLYLGFANPNFPLLCGRLHTTAAIAAPLGAANAAGDATLALNSGWLSSMTGIALHAQALAIDSSAPGGGYLSNGIFLCLPKAIGGEAFKVKRVYSTTSSTAATATAAVTSSCQPTQLR
ncbi:MAG: hypothetical protein KDC87_09365 [Planctomycetes bacterium]|nr:hypothetical protein [Planctomycetota bacterium]MCB9869847.1 hypothetical protein [Planctomycetota bacterium]